MKQTFTAGRLAEIAGVTREQLDQWEADGSLCPERDSRNHRFFPAKEVRKALDLAGMNVSRRISIVNQKGGVGKTTTVFNLSAALVLEGRRVLAVDLDAQASLTLSYGLSPDDCEKTSHDLMISEEVTADETIVPTRWEGLDLIPADIRLASADVLLREMIMREQILRNKMESVLGRYDFVLFDCPPNLSTITINSLVASTDAVVPMETQFYSIRAVDDLSRTFHLLADRMGHHLDVHMLPMKIDRRVKTCREFLARMEESFGARLLTPIRTDANLMKAPLAAEPAVYAFASSRGSRDYCRVARELVEHAARGDAEAAAAE